MLKRKFLVRIYHWIPLPLNVKAELHRACASFIRRFKLCFASGASLPLAPAHFVFGGRLASEIRIVRSSKPKISIVIPVCENLELALQCLTSISDNPPEAPFEVIVVDDKPADESLSNLRLVTGIQVIQNDKSIGFRGSCNIGSYHATGQYLIFLSADTVVTAGWADELLQTFHEFPETGLVSSKLVDRRGSILGAGGPIESDGNSWDFRRAQNPSAPQFNYAREVFCCSGLSIMTPANLFSRVGGFAKPAWQAYGENDNFAVKILGEGFRAMYQPLSMAIHYGGVTRETHDAPNAKLDWENWGIKLRERWFTAVSILLKPTFDAASYSRPRYWVLVLDQCTPKPDHDAGSVTVTNFMILLREMGFQVTFIPEDNFAYVPQYTERLQRIGIEALFAPHVGSVKQHLRQCGSRYHLVFCFRPKVLSRNLKSIRKFCPSAKLLYHAVDLHYLRMAREAELRSDAAGMIAAAKMKSFELNVISGVDAAIVHSPVELALIKAEVTKVPLHVFPLIVSANRVRRGFYAREGIAFIGGYQHPPNVDAVNFFVKEVMPLLRTRLRGVHFYIVGANPPSEIFELEHHDVFITGHIANLEAYLDNIKLAVAPLRYGAGVKGKIGTAMSLGLPTIASSIAVEGMGLVDGETTVIADSPELMVDAIIKVYEDSAVWEEISRKSEAFASSMWGGEAASRKLASILGSLGFETPKQLRPLRLCQDGDVVGPDSN